MTKLPAIEEMFIDAAVAQELTAHTLLQLPQEACGVLLGTAPAGGIRIEQFHPIRNVAPDPLHAFTFHPEQWIPFCLKSEKLIGIVHSHPHSLPIPSQDDLTHLHVYGRLLEVYLICTPNKDATSTNIQAYRIVHPSNHYNVETTQEYGLTYAQLTLT